EWLAYLSSDELEGRNTFSEGLGLAAAYIADQLKSWGVRPGGPSGSYFQRVAVLGVKSENHSTVTVEAGGQKKTFENRAGVTLPANVGGKRTLESSQIEFLGYGLDAPLAHHNDYEGKNVKGKFVVWLGPTGPQGLDARTYRRMLAGRSRFATEQQGALASIGPQIFGRPGGGANRGNQGGARQGGGQGQAGQARAGHGTAQSNNAQQGPPRGADDQARPQGQFGAIPIETADFTTVQRLDSPLAPSVTAQDEFFEMLFSGQDVKYSELKDKAAKGEPLPSFALKDVKISINLDANYRVVRTQFTRNVIGIVDGSDPALNGTYVAFGAHYDHVGYAEGEIVQTKDGARRAGAVGSVTEGAIEDRIWNGADDDGSGTVTELAIARAFALGPKPRRSLLFVWHAGEEKGLL